MRFKVVYLGPSSLCNVSINSKNFRSSETGGKLKKKNNVYLQFGESAKTRKRRIGELRDHVVTQISEMDNMQLGINKTNNVIRRYDNLK